MLTLAEAVERCEPPDGFDKFALRLSSFEAAWKYCERADWMLWMLQHSRSCNDRRLRLFTCRCVRRWWHFLHDTRSQRAVAAAEGFALGRVSKSALEYMTAGAEKAVQEALAGSKVMLARAAQMALLTLQDDLLKAAKEASHLAAIAEHSIKDTQSYEKQMLVLSEQAEWLREILPNPFPGSASVAAAKQVESPIGYNPRPADRVRPATAF